ncbi:MAG: 4Fe-4S binding protein [Candidatus Thorarchaeota archaeon]
MILGDEGQVVVQPTICDSCGACERNCPIGAIELHNDIVYVCDLCGGRPQCVDVCTEGAIRHEPASEFSISLAVFKEQTKGLNSSEKRRQYLEKAGVAIRESWRS